MAETLGVPCLKADELWRWIDDNQARIPGYDDSAAKQLRDALERETATLGQEGAVVVTLEGTESE